MSMMKTVSAALLLSAFSGSAFAQTYFIKDAHVVTNSDAGEFEKASVIVRNGRLSDIGPNLSAPSGATVIDAPGQWVTPGLFAPLARIGLVEIGMESSTNDTHADDASTSVSDMAADAFNPQSPIIDNTRIEGVTHAAVVGSASHNIFGGTGIIINTSGAFDSVEDEAAFVFVQYGSSGANAAGGSRQAAMNQFRAALDDAAAYPGRYDGPEDGDALPRRDASALSQAARGVMPIVVAADRASDLLSLIKLKRDYNLDIIIYGGAEAWMVADELKRADMKVMIDPMDNLPRSFNAVGARLDNGAKLEAAGVDVAIMTRSADLSHQVRLLPQHAGNAVTNGMSREGALSAVTSVPAEWFGVEAGRLVDGKKADLVVWDGDPLEVTSSPTLILLDGEEQSLASRQTALRDRYNPTKDDDRHYKYR